MRGPRRRQDALRQRQPLGLRPPAKRVSPMAVHDDRNAQQADLVNLSLQGAQVVAPNADHYIHLDQPDVVMHAIESVVTTARKTSH